MTNFFRTVFVSLSLALAAIAPARATVNTQASSATVLGTGSQTVFQFQFIGVGNGYINVLYTDASGNQTTLVQGSGPAQYQISLNTPVQGAIWGVGGTITYNPNSTPIPVGSSLTISRVLPYLQGISLQNQASYGQFSKAAESASDLVDMQVGQLNTSIGYAVRANPANSAPPNPLPPAGQAASMGLCFDGTGNNIVACATLPSGTVSTAMQPVVDAVSLAAGRAAFGLGSAAQENIGAGLQDDGSGNMRVDWPTTPDAANVTVPASYHMTQRIATGPFTYTLSRANTYWNGFGFWIYVQSNPITVVVQSTDNFIGQATGVPVTLPAGSVSFVTTNGASSGAWYVQQAGTPQQPAHYPGESIKMRTTTCPTGTLLEDGSAVSRTTYATLFAAMGTTWGAGDGSTTFNVDNSGGYADRGFVSGGSVDPGRTFGSTQQDQLQDHGHQYATSTGSFAGALNGGSVNFNQGTSTPNTSGVSAPARAGTETRMKNITVLSCIFTGNTL